MCAKVVDKTENQVVSGIEGEDLQQKVESVPASRVNAVSQQQFPVTEVLEIGEGKPPAQTIIRSGANANVQDFKVVSGKVILKGEVSLKLLYAPEAEDVMPEAMEYVIPYSQMLDCDGVEEESVCDVNVDVTNFNVQIKNDSSGENTLFEADVKLSVNLVAYEDTEVSVVTDAYSTDYDLSLDYQSKMIPRLVEIVREEG